MMLTGWLIIAFLLFVYQGGTTEEPTWMKPHWWGILGLIGWAYLLNAIIYLFAGNRAIIIGGVLAVLYALNSLEFVDGFESVKFIVSASNHALVMSGVMATVLFIRYREEGNEKGFLSGLIILAILSLVFGYATRPEWGISKIYATPSWASICAGFSFIVYVILYIITDKFQRANWAFLFQPAGRSTLTCYLIPYFYYAIVALLGLSLPDFFLTGWIGIIKSLLFALLIIQVTWVFEQFNIRLKI